MHRSYTIVKKNSTAHQAAVAALNIKQTDIIAVAGTHVLIPATRKIEMGHNVSHAKNRTKRAFLPNTRSVTVEIQGEKRSIKLSNRDLRTYKKLAQVA